MRLTEEEVAFLQEVLGSVAVSGDAVGLCYGLQRKVKDLLAGFRGERAKPAPDLSEETDLLEPAGNLSQIEG